ncbi:MAG: phytanoyl-CoA dioxygenase family protein [Pirellulales bacterium]
MTDVTALTTHGTRVPDELLGKLHATGLQEASYGETLRRNLNDNGYLFLPDALKREDVLTARNEILAELAAVGEICDPSSEGRSTGTSQRGELVDDLGAHWKSISERENLRRVSHAGPIRRIMQSVLGGDVKPYDFLWLRATHVGRASAYHFDHVYMNRGTDHLLTVWTPLGDVALEEGPIALIEGSHQWDDLIDEYRGFDVEKDNNRQGHVTMDPVGLASQRGSRLLTAEFRAGDVLIFPMFMLHGSLDNRSPTGRVRLSCDTRYQLASEPFDPRWIGANPIGHGEGYASISGAKPATSEPLFR